MAKYQHVKLIFPKQPRLPDGSLRSTIASFQGRAKEVEEWKAACVRRGVRVIPLGRK
jgi:hypothetical protein